MKSAVPHRPSASFSDGASMIPADWSVGYSCAQEVFGALAVFDIGNQSVAPVTGVSFTPLVPRVSTGSPSA